ncbi:MAG: hypothetical protein ACYCZU_02100 [Devosia sp.]
MSEYPENRFKLTGQRIFLIILVVVALGLAAVTIVASLSGWQRLDSETTPRKPAA